MGEPEPAHGIAAPGTQDGLGCLVIRKMSRLAEYALLEHVGIGTAQQPGAIMVGFQDE